MNPSRVFTPEGSVSWGGSWMAIYPLDSPGGFQILGRTVLYFDLFGIKDGFVLDRPWLYQNFDLITFYQVSEIEMQGLICSYKSGRYEFSWKLVEFDMTKHNATLQETAAEVQQLKKTRAKCQDVIFKADKESLERWRAEKK